MGWLEKAVSQNKASAQYWLADCFEHGMGVEQNVEAAFTYYLAAAKQGRADAQGCVGRFYQQGLWVEQNHAQALLWLELAVAQGDGPACDRLGCAYLRGNELDGVDQDLTQAQKCFLKGIESDDDADCMFHLGLVYQQQGDTEQAKHWFAQAAKNGYVEPAESLPGDDDYNQGIEHQTKAEYSLASACLIRASNAGHSQAMFQLAMYYRLGWGVEVDLQKAFQCFGQAAEKDHLKAQYWLGCCYGDGDGVDTNIAKCIEWIERAAQRGLADAQHHLGVIYCKGPGIKHDVNKAKEWLQKAADQNHEDAIKYLAELEASKKKPSVLRRLFGG